MYINYIHKFLKTINNIKIIEHNNSGLIIQENNSNKILYIHFNGLQFNEPSLKDIKEFINIRDKLSPNCIGIYLSKVETTEIKKVNRSINIHNTYIEKIKNDLIYYLHYNFNYFSYEDDGSAVMIEIN